MPRNETSLRVWLRREPVPDTVRFKNDDEQTSSIDVSETPEHTRWKTIEETLLASRATLVECMKKGKVLRARTLELSAEEAAETARYEFEAEGKKIDGLLSRERRDMAAIFDRYGARLNEAFERGNMAAATSQEQLVGLVTTLTNSLSNSIVNMVNVSTNLVALMQSGAEEDARDTRSDTKEKLLGKVLDLAASKARQQGEKE